MPPDSDAARSFECPNPLCDAEYIALVEDFPPLTPPRCERCDTVFAQRENDKYLRYISTWFD